MHRITTVRMPVTINGVRFKTLVHVCEKCHVVNGKLNTWKCRPRGVRDLALAPKDWDSVANFREWLEKNEAELIDLGRVQYINDYIDSRSEPA